MTLELRDADATAQAGRVLAHHVRPGDAIALIGDLGAGKTALVTALVAELGGGTAVSPTFALVNEYRCAKGACFVVWHVDLYRVDREAELIELGLGEMFGDPRSIVVVEWADRFPVMPADHLRLALAHATGSALDFRNAMSARLAVSSSLRRCA